MESRIERVKMGLMSAAVVGTFAFTGCGDAVKRQTDVYAQMTPIPSDESQRMLSLIRETVGKECKLPTIVLARIGIEIQGEVVREGLILPPKKEGDPTMIGIPSDSYPGQKEMAKNLNITQQAFQGIIQENGLIHEGYHSCSPSEYEGKQRPNPEIIRYVNPQKYKDKEGKEFTVTTIVKRFENVRNPGLVLQATLVATYSDGHIESQSSHEPGNFEELTTYWLTWRKLVELHGEESKQVKTHGRISPYFDGQVIIDNLFQSAGFSREDVLKAKQENDAKTIFDSLQMGLIKAGQASGIQPLRNTTDNQYRSLMFYRLLTSLSNEKAIEHIDQNIFRDTLGNYFYGKPYTQLSREQQEKVFAVAKKILFE